MPEEKKRYVRLTFFEDNTEWGSCLMPLDDTSWLRDELEGCKLGQRFIVEVVEMTKAEYDALPEFSGF